jgi:hypothetical protein
MESAGDDLSSQAVFHDAALKFLDQQVVSNSELDNRTSQNFQVGSTVVTIAFGLLSLSQAAIPHRADICLYAAFGAYALVLVFCFAASLYRKIDYRPDIPTVRGYVDELAGSDLQLWVALEYMSSTEINEKKLKNKSRLVGGATIFLYIEGACLAGAALLTLL